MSVRVLSLPGWNGAGPAHWQTLWERLDARIIRVEQADWERPSLELWRAQVLAALGAAPEPAVLLAHSLGAVLAAHVASSPEARCVVGALLVVPPDLDSLGADLPASVRAFGPVPRARLPFASTLVISDDDPYLTGPRAQVFAEAWGSSVTNVGARGHVNGDSDLGTWPEGFELLRQLRRRAPFALDPRLAADAHLIGSGPLSALLLFDDARYPWFVLVPQRSGVEELAQLSNDDRIALQAESASLASGLASAFPVDKVNVGALGNVVRQLHVHHVGRRLGDVAWPGPVWGHSPRQPLGVDARDRRVAALFAQPIVAGTFARRC
jgi:uncharacterized protein